MYRKSKLICRDCEIKIESGEDIQYQGNPSTQTQQLISRIKQLGYDVEPELRRIYAGHDQRSCGAWSWSMKLKDGIGDIGSQWPVKRILESKELIIRTDVGSVDISPK